MHVALLGNISCSRQLLPVHRRLIILFPVLADLNPVTNGADGVAVSGDYAYVTGDFLWTAEISNPATAFISGPFHCQNGGDATVEDGQLYLSVAEQSKSSSTLRPRDSQNLAGTPGYADGIEV
jgi:hypothetical protein